MAKSAKAIREGWLSLAKAGLKLAERVHQHALTTLEHVKEHGDLSLCSFAVNSLWKTGMHRRALIQWFERHGLCRMTIQNGQVVFVKKAKADLKNIDIEVAKLDPFYADDKVDGKTDEDTSYDAFKAIRSVLKKQEKVVKGEHKRYVAKDSKLLPVEIVDAINNYLDMYEGKEEKAPAKAFSHPRTSATPVPSNVKVA